MREAAMELDVKQRIALASDERIGIRQEATDRADDPGAMAETFSEKRLACGGAEEALG